MSECRGNIPVSAKVDAQMRDRIDAEAERLGVYRAEVVRRMLDAATELCEGDVSCPFCKEELQVEL